MIIIYANFYFIYAKKLIQLSITVLFLGYFKFISNRTKYRSRVRLNFSEEKTSKPNPNPNPFKLIDLK